jgi:cold shock CspA family protein
MNNRIIGKVKWWNAVKGFGFLEQPNGPDVFIHYSAVKGEGFKNLSEGQDVEFTIEKGPKGLQASDVIAISHEFPSESKPPTPILTQQIPPTIFQNAQKEIQYPTNQPHQGLRIFLCHSSNDKPLVRNLYQRLKSDNFDPWLDEEKLLPGQDWRQEITKAVRRADVVLVCLSRGSVSKAGYVQKEIKDALDIADEQPEGTIFLIPLKLEECEVPERVSRWQWVNYFDENGYKKLVNALHARANSR